MPKCNGPGIELLADPTRRRIIAILAIRPWRPSALAREIGLSRPATTRQLRLLHGAGLVRASRSMRDGRSIVYHIEPDRHGHITAWLAGTEIGRPHAAKVDPPNPADRADAPDLPSPQTSIRGGLDGEDDRTPTDTPKTRS